MPYPTLPYSPYSTLFYPILPYPALPYPTLPHPTLPYHSQPCPTLAYLPFPNSPTLPILSTLPSYPTLADLAWSSLAYRSENQIWASWEDTPKNRCSQWQSHRFLRYKYAGYNTTSPHWNLAYTPYTPYAFCGIRFCDSRCRYKSINQFVRNIVLHISIL